MHDPMPIICGLRAVNSDASSALASLPSDSVDCCVTSPPYWALRDYGVDGQIGLESSPDQWCARLVAVFEEVRRVLKPSGTLWLNVGDCHITHAKSGTRYKRKDLVGQPWMLAFALREAGWYLRRDIIWHKPNAMPESTTDRPTTAHEYLFLLAKSQKYFYDASAIKEKCTGNAHPRGNGHNRKIAGWAHGQGSHDPVAHSRRERSVGPNSRFNKDRDPYHQLPSRIQSKQNRSFSEAVRGICDSRNKRSVWTIATRGYKGTHFATFPEALVEPCILAGCPVGGTVLDPFAGVFTTAAVALRLGREAIAIELNQQYFNQGMARCKTISQMS